jgi:hypothetical protein
MESTDSQAYIAPEKFLSNKWVDYTYIAGL